MDVIIDRREELLTMMRRHGARNPRIFGSVARREDGPDSDVDFLVEMEADRSLLALISLQQEIERSLERKVDLLTSSALSRRASQCSRAQVPGRRHRSGLANRRTRSAWSDGQHSPSRRGPRAGIGFLSDAGTFNRGAETKLPTTVRLPHSWQQTRFWSLLRCL